MEQDIPYDTARIEFSESPLGNPYPAASDGDQPFYLVGELERDGVAGALHPVPGFLERLVCRHLLTTGQIRLDNEQTGVSIVTG